jgi:hypothetical protein
MGDGPPCCDGPDLNVASYPGPKFPGAELASDFSKTSNDLIHVGTLRRVFLDHIGDKRLHKLEAMVSLVSVESGSVLQDGKRSADLHIIFSNQVS